MCEGEKETEKGKETLRGQRWVYKPKSRSRYPRPARLKAPGPPYTGSSQKNGYEDGSCACHSKPHRNSFPSALEARE